VVPDSLQVKVFIEFKWKLNLDPFCDVYDMKHPDKDGKTVKSFCKKAVVEGVIRLITQG
jgi:hypothetical protein